MLFTIKRLLACSDLSPHSDQVLLNAEALRKRTGAKLDILTVSDDENEGARFLSEQLKRLNIDATPVVLSGDPAKNIQERTSSGKIKYDLLLIGHNSRKGLIHNILGSVARTILSNTGIPTLVLKHELKFQKIGSLVDNTSPLGWMITSSLDFYRDMKFDKIQFINLWHELPEPFGHGGSSSEFKSRLLEEIQYFEHEKEAVSVRVEPARELQVADHLYEIIGEEKVDLAVMKRNRGKNLKTLILGSETLRMLEKDNLNLLILPV